MTRRTMLLGGVAIAAIGYARLPAADRPRPVLGTFGFDTDGMEPGVSPGDDFFGYANGRWLRDTEIPEDEAFFGVTSQLDNLSRRRVREIIERAAAAPAPSGTEARKIGDFYAAFMDETTIEALNITALAADLAPIRAARDRTELARELGKALSGFGPSLFPIFVAPDVKAPGRYMAYVSQGGLGLPDRDYYLGDDARYATIRNKYLDHIMQMLALAGVAPEGLRERASGIFALERRMAEVHWTRVDSRDDDKTYNPSSAADLQRSSPGFPWIIYLAAAGLSDRQTVVISQPSAISGMARIYADTPLEALQDWAVLHMTKTAAPVMPAAFVSAEFLFSGQTVSGQQEIQDRWKRGVALVNRSLGDAVGKLYVQACFPASAKAGMDQLVRNIIGAMDRRLATRPWMEPETRLRARRKLSGFTPKIGYPDTWRDYSRLRIEPGDAYGNLKRARAFEHRRSLAKLAAPVDRDEWQMSPVTINAYADRTMNEIVFPAAILQPPFFDPEADPAVNYGAIGAVIGHELSHHFDDQGRKYDAEGRLADWWTPGDVAHFQRLADTVVAQYERYEPLPGRRINGALTLGENIADIAGLALAYDAYRTSLGSRQPPIIDGFTGEQRFFLGYAQINRLKYREKNLERRLTTDSHTPAHIRPNAVRNLDAWYLAFDVRPAAKLYLPPESRITIW